MAKKKDIKENVNDCEKPSDIVESDVYRRHEYNAFVVWYGTPSNYRGLPPDRLLKLGIKEEYHDLMKITTLSQFAKEYGIHNNTLTNWKNRKHFNSDVKDYVDKTIFQQFYARVATSFTMKTIESGDAQRFMNWMKMFAGHVEKVEIDANVSENVDVNHMIDGAEIMDIVASRLIKSGRISAHKLEELTKQVEDVSFEELPSQQQYDFDSMESKPQKEEKKVDKDIKNKLVASLKKHKKK